MSTQPPIPHPHAVMFHHFHGGRHRPGQGSLSAAQFADMIDWLADRYRLLSPQAFMEGVERGTLAPADICLTFDDALLCQVEVAVPVMEARGIRAFFFVYSSPFLGNPDYLEVYRHFRMTAFESVDAFYERFFEHVRRMLGDAYGSALASYDASTYLAGYPFYTAGDKWFRFLRDEVLGKPRYEAAMHELMREMHFDERRAMAELWMTDDHLRQLEAAGHVVGLHSNSHPTALHQLGRSEQASEYQANHRHLSGVLARPPQVMAHPCGNYNADTLQILRSLGVRVGFCSSIGDGPARSPLEVPREDHANVLRAMAT